MWINHGLVHKLSTDLSFQHLPQVGNSGLDFSVRFDLPGDFVAGMHHGRVVLAPEFLADFWQAGIGELAGQVHGNLTRDDNLPYPLLSFKVRH